MGREGCNPPTCESHGKGKGQRGKRKGGREGRGRIDTKVINVVLEILEEWQGFTHISD